MIYKTGQKPGRGRYICINCGMILTLDQHDDNLPPCPKCHATVFGKSIKP